MDCKSHKPIVNFKNRLEITQTNKNNCSVFTAQTIWEKKPLECGRCTLN